MQWSIFLFEGHNWKPQVRRVLGHVIKHILVERVNRIRAAAKHDVKLRSAVGRDTSEFTTPSDTPNCRVFTFEKKSEVGAISAVTFTFSYK